MRNSDDIARAYAVKLFKRLAGELLGEEESKAIDEFSRFSDKDLVLDLALKSGIPDLYQILYMLSTLSITTRTADIPDFKGQGKTVKANISLFTVPIFTTNGDSEYFYDVHIVEAIQAIIRESGYFPRTEPMNLILCPVPLTLDAALNCTQDQLSDITKAAITDLALSPANAEFTSSRTAIQKLNECYTNGGFDDALLFVGVRWNIFDHGIFSDNLDLEDLGDVPDEFVEIENRVAINSAWEMAAEFRSRMWELFDFPFMTDGPCKWFEGLGSLIESYIIGTLTFDLGYKLPKKGYASGTLLLYKQDDGGLSIGIEKRNKIYGPVDIPRKASLFIEERLKNTYDHTGFKVKYVEAYGVFFGLRE